MKPEERSDGWKRGKEIKGQESEEKERTGQTGLDWKGKERGGGGRMRRYKGKRE